MHIRPGLLEWLVERSLMDVLGGPSRDNPEHKETRRELASREETQAIADLYALAVVYDAQVTDAELAKLDWALAILVGEAYESKELVRIWLKRRTTHTRDAQLCALVRERVRAIRAQNRPRVLESIRQLLSVSEGKAAGAYRDAAEGESAAAAIKVFEEAFGG